MRIWREVRNFASQKISLDTGDSASNAVVKRSVFINQRCAECVCLYYGLRVCGQKYIIIVCDRLRKSCTTIEWERWRHRVKFNENCPRNEELVAPLSSTYNAIQAASHHTLLRGPSEKVLISWFVKWKSRKWDSLSDAEICNAIRIYEKRKASKKKKREVLGVLAKTPRLNRFF